MLAAQSSFPLTAMISLTERCPLSCTHCYLCERPSLVADELTTQELVQLLDELAALGVIKITFTGGEPGLRKDLCEIVQEAASRHFVVSVKSSAALFSPLQTEQLYRSGAHNLTITLLHTDSSAHDAFVGMQGAFHNAVNAAQTMVKAGGQLHVTIPVMHWNISVIPALLQWCHEQQFVTNFDVRIYPRLDGGGDTAKLRASEDQILKLFSYPEVAKSIKSTPKNMSERICSAGSTDVHFCANGDVWPCTMIPLTLGNLRQSSFANIWQNSEVKKQLDALRWGDNPACHHCAYSDYCGRCPADAFLEHGNVEKSSSQDCLLARLRHSMKSQ